MKRYEGRSNLLEGAGWLLDRLTYTLYIDNHSVILPKNQGKLLEVFLLHRGEPLQKKIFAWQCGGQWNLLMKMLCRSTLHA